MLDTQNGEVLREGDGRRSESFRLLLSVKEAAYALGLGQSTVLDLTAKGEIPSLKIGQRRLYSITALTKWAEDQESAANSGS